MPTADDVFNGLQSRQRAAQAATSSSITLENDPDEAARALELERITGVPSQAIWGDVKGFEQSHKAALAGDILRNNPIISDWVTKHPLAGAISSDDLGNLDQVSTHFPALRSPPVFGGQELDVASKALKAFGEEFTKPWPPDMSQMSDRQIQYYETYPFMKVFKGYSQFLETALKQGTELVAQRPLSATMAAFHAGSAEWLQQKLGVAPETAEKITRDLHGIAESEMARHGVVEGEPILQEGAFKEAFNRVRDAIKDTRAWGNTSDIPPPGVNKDVDKAHEIAAKQGLKTLEDALKDSDKSAVLQRDKDMYGDFINSGVPGKTLSLEAAGVRRLYGDKQPAPGDGLLGDIPGLAAQLAGAETHGGRVEFPLAEWFKTDPEVRKALKDDVVVYKNGDSANSAETRKDYDKAAEGELTAAQQSRLDAEHTIAIENGDFEKANAIEAQKAVGVSEPAPMDVWHFTPNDFDQFDEEHIGSGQGAASYGRGFYAAMNREVAESYRYLGEQAATTWTINGKKIDAVGINSLDNAATPEAGAAWLLHTSNGKREIAIKEGERRLKRAEEVVLRDTAEGGELFHQREFLQATLDVLRHGDIQDPVTKGGLLRLRYHAEPEQLLDWDRPLSEQHPDVQEKVRRIPGAIQEGKENPTGEQIAANIASLHGDYKSRAVEVVKALKGAGIPGMKYLDQFSRGARSPRELERLKQAYQDDIDVAEDNLKITQKLVDTTPTDDQHYATLVRGLELDKRSLEQLKREMEQLDAPPTHNVVMYHDNLIEILEKNGQAVASVRKAAGTETMPGPKGWEAVEPRAPGKKAPNIIPKGTWKTEPIRFTKDDGEGITFQSSHKFTLNDIIPKLSLTGMRLETQALMQFFNDKSLKFAGDLPVYVVDRAYLDREGIKIGAWHQRNENGQTYIVIPNDIIDGTSSSQVAAHIVMHESAHAITVEAIDRFPELRRKIEYLMDDVLKQLTPAQRENFKYAFYGNEDSLRSNFNAKEFVAEATALYPFNELLHSMRVSEGVGEKIGLGRKTGSIWDHVKDVIKNIWNKILGYTPDVSAMDALFHLRWEIEEATKKLEAMGKEPVYGARTEPAEAPRQLEMKQATRMEDRPLFKQAAAIGMSEKDYRAHLALIQKRSQEDMEAFGAKAKKLAELQQTKAWKDQEARTRSEVENALLHRPDIATDNLLRTGTLWGDKLKGRIRLDSDKITAEQKAGLPDDYHKAGGIDPIDAAHNIGYGSVEEMLAGLRQLHAEREGMKPKGHFNKLVDDLTKERMSREFGDLNEKILEEAKDHVVSQTQIDIIDQEVLRLATENKAELPITKAELDSWVEKKFNEMPITMHDRDNYIAASGRAGREAYTALLDGKPGEALKLRQQQSIALRMARLAKDYEKERKSLETIFDRMSKREIKNRDQGAVAHLRDQMVRAGQGVQRSVQALAEDIQNEGLGSLTNFVKSAEGPEGSQYPFLMPDWMLGNWRKRLDDMTYSEFSDYYKAMKQLDTYGRTIRQIDLKGEKRDLDEVRDTAINHLEEQRLGKAPTRYKATSGEGFVERVKAIWNGWFVQPESIFYRWDLGDKRNGFFLTNFFYPGARAINDFSRSVKRFSKRLEEEMNKAFDGEALAKRMPDLLTTPDGRKVVMTKEAVLRMISDMGSESNRDKFLRGWNIDPEVVWNYLKKNTTKEDWDFIEHLGEIHSEIFDLLKDMIRDEHGVVPDSIALEPFVDPHGVTRKGWYSPMMYDIALLQMSKKLTNTQLLDINTATGLMGNGFLKHTTATGAEIERTAYAGPTDLSLARLPQKMTQVLYDAHMRPFVVNTGKFLRDPRIRDAIRINAGKAKLDALDSWLNDMIGASRGQITAADSAFASVVEFLRRNIAAQLIGLSIRTAEKHGPSAMIASMADVGVRNVAREMINLARTDPKTMERGWNYSNESLEIQRRTQHFVDQFGGQVEMLRFGSRGFKAWRNWMLEHSSFMVAYSDLLSTKAMWNASHKDEMARLAEERPGVDPETYRGEAMDIADHDVRSAHGSTSLISRAGLMRKGAFGRNFVTFYTYFGQMLQREIEAAWRSRWAVKNLKEGDKALAWSNSKRAAALIASSTRSEEHTSELQSQFHLVCRLLL